MINDTQIADMISAWAENRYDDVDFGKLIKELQSLRKEIKILKEMLMEARSE